MSNKDNAIFPEHSANHANQLAYGDCPQCGAPLQLKHVGKSTFLGCTRYPDCDYAKSLNTREVTTLKVIEDSHCPQCQAQLAVKKGRYGMFIGCTNFPSCHFISTNQQAKIETEYRPVACPRCEKGLLQKRQNRFGKFFYACDNYPKCKYLINYEPILKACSQCNATIMLIKSKDDDEYVCANPKCGVNVAEQD